MLNSPETKQKFTQNDRIEPINDLSRRCERDEGRREKQTIPQGVVIRQVPQAFLFAHHSQI